MPCIYPINLVTTVTRGRCGCVRLSVLCPFIDSVKRSSAATKKHVHGRVSHQRLEVFLNSGGCYDDCPSAPRLQSHAVVIRFLDKGAFCNHYSHTLQVSPTQTSHDYTRVCVCVCFNMQLMHFHIGCCCTIERPLRPAHGDHERTR